MEYGKLKKHKGYLLIASAIIVVIISLVASLVLEMFTGDTKSAGHTAQSTSAFYLSSSALQLAKRDIVANEIGCVFINSTSLYTNATLSTPPGIYTVDSCYSKDTAKLNGNLTAAATTIELKNYSNVISALSSNISSTANSITVNDATNFRLSGSVKIDSEYVSYASKLGNTLLNVTRGVAGTTPAAHSSGAIAYQGFFIPTENLDGIIQIDDELISYKNIGSSSGILLLQNATRGIGGTTPAAHAVDAKVYHYQCALTAKAAVPNFSDPNGMRIVQENLIAYDAKTLLLSGYEPALVSTGTVDLKGITKVENIDPDADFEGSTILSSSTINITGASETAFNGTTASTQGNYQDDIKQNLAGLTPLFNNIFSIDSIDIFKGMATKIIDPANFTTTPMLTNDIVLVNGPMTLNNVVISVAPLALIVDGNLIINGNSNNIIIGTLDYPTILFINGDFTSAGGSIKYFEINGLLYIAGQFVFTGTSQITINGFSAIEGNVDITGTTNITLDPSIIDRLKDSGLITTNFYNKAFEKKELFR